MDKKIKVNWKMNPQVLVYLCTNRTMYCIWILRIFSFGII
ncbi:hypothetical protein LSH36_73g05017 [Paralvinella palmiformis]|uniref:Uncharacterized protein n=1 Tax=Paralvinella palmiformis TaxID=53620 RepID=A0AAD9K2S9_9ANNE|nr:hypothetical protein LSH36_73g05017 [Paralvinella palmiformis]